LGTDATTRSVNGSGRTIARPSSHALNRRAHLARRFVAGNPLGDARGARGRFRELRDLTRADPAAVAADQARLLRLGLQLPLFDLVTYRIGRG